MSAFKSYKDLKVYQISRGLAIEIHLMSLNLPKFKMYEEGSRIRRSSKAITSNIVEEFGRREYKNDFLRFITFAISECDETQLHLDFLYNTGSLKSEGLFNELSEKYIILGKMLGSFREAILTKHLSNK